MGTLPKYFHKNKSIKSINIEALEWRDKTYGNSYFSAKVVVNFGLKNQFSFRLPFQYGYGDHYVDQASKELELMGAIGKNFFHHGRINHKFNLHYTKREGCLKREVKTFGGE